MKSAALFSCLFAAVYIHKSIVVFPLCIRTDYAWQDVCLPVCLSACLSVTRRYCVETAKRILELFHRLRLHHSSFFLPIYTKRYSNIPTGSQGRRMQVGMKNIAIFDQYRFISEMTQDRTIERQYTGIRMRSIERCYFQ